MGKGGVKQAEVIRQHSRVQHQRMLAQEEEISKRRNRERNGKPSKGSILLKRMKLLYIPTIIFLCMGVIMTFGSIIRLGEGTIFWEKKEQFHVIGPVVLAIGVILLLTTVGLVTHFGGKLKNEAVTTVPEQYPPFTKELLVFDPIWKAYTGHGCSIPVMSFEEEEDYVKNVKTKPKDFREDNPSIINELVLPIGHLEALNNNDKNFSQKEFTWSENLPPKYSLQCFEENNPHVSTPLLAGKNILLEKRVVLTEVSGDMKSFSVSYEDIWKLPESNI